MADVGSKDKTPNQRETKVRHNSNRRTNHLRLIEHLGVPRYSN